MTQQQKKITDADLQALLAQNPLAAEQLRRIMAERQVAELRAELDERKNGFEAKEVSKVAGT
jgi:hypothetical protein